MSCGVVNESLRVVGLDIDAASENWDSSGSGPLESSIEVLQNMSALTFLRLPVGPHGDLEMLGRLEQLTHLRLSGRGITGSLKTLNKFPRLKFLVLWDTRIGGSLVALQQLLDLEVLDIRSYWGDVQGHLSDLQELRALRYISLQSVSVTGSIEEISILPSIEGLQLRHLPDVQGSFSNSRWNLGVLVLHQCPGVQVSLRSLKGMSNLTYLWLVQTHVEGSIQELQNSEPVVLHITSPVDPWAVKAPLSALQQMRSLNWLALESVDVQGSVAALADLSLSYLQLEAVDRHQVTGSVQSLRAMPFLFLLFLNNCDIAGPMGILGNLRALRWLQIQYTLIHGSLHVFLGMSSLKNLELRGLDIKGGLQALSSDLPFAAEKVDLSYLALTGAIPPLPASIMDLTLMGNRLYSSAPIKIRLPNVRYLDLSNNSITNGIIKDIYLQPRGTMNVRGNALRCPIVPPNGTVLLFEDCQENVVFLVIVTSVAVFAVGVVIWWMKDNSDINVATDESSWSAWLKFILIVSGIRLFGYADLITDIFANLSMLQELDVTDQCTPFNYYERFVPFVPLRPWTPDLWHHTARTNITEYFAMLHDSDRIHTGVSVGCESHFNCVFRDGVCKVEVADPHAWFRVCLLTGTSIIVLREVVKLCILLFHALPGRKLPDKHKFFCVSSPFAPFLALICTGLRPMFMFRPGLADVVWQLVYDGLLEDVPQIVLQLVFLKHVARSGLSWFQLCSQLLSAAGMSVMCLRAINLCLWRRGKYQNLVLPAPPLPQPRSPEPAPPPDPHPGPRNSISTAVMSVDDDLRAMEMLDTSLTSVPDPGISDRDPPTHLPPLPAIQTGTRPEHVGGTGGDQNGLWATNVAGAGATRANADTATGPLMPPLLPQTTPPLMDTPA